MAITGGQTDGSLKSRRAHTKSKGGKPTHPAKLKKTTGKQVANTKKGKSPSPPTNEEPPEKVVHEPEPAGEDDHAFFDNEENEGYAKFMLSLDESELTTFSKRAKDRVAVPPLTKKKIKSGQPSPPAEVAVAGAAADVPAAGDAPATKTPSARHAEALVDAKRRKASTMGWVEEDTGPQRLPIKTRHGVLKPNERMQQAGHGVETDKSQEFKAGKSAASAGTGSELTTTAATESTQSLAGENIDGDESRGEELANGDLSHMSEDSVYDSADSDEGESTGLDGVGNGDQATNKRATGGSGSGGGGGRGVDLAVLRQRRFLQKKMLMAELCETILGAPEESLIRPKTVAKGEDERSRMEQLFSLMEDDDDRVRHFAILSQYAVFKDIIPGYRIRVPTAAELATKVSKEVHRVRGQEAALLKSYQQYLKALEAAIQAAVSSDGGGASAAGARSLAAASIRCMCGLLSAHPHFNFRSNLVRTVVAGTNHKLSEVRETCCRCLGGVFTEDTQGEVSLEVTKAVAKYVKERKFQVSEGTIRCLSALPLRVREDERARAKARVKSKNRKRRREGSVEAGLMEADARVDDDVRAKSQADALHEACYNGAMLLEA